MRFLEKFKFSKIKAAALALVMMFACTILPANFVQASAVDVTASSKSISISKSSTPNDFEEVAKYIKICKETLNNFSTNSQARKIGWNASKGNLAKVAPGKSIGRDIFT